MGALDIIKNKTLTYEQIVMNLAKEGENSLNVLNISEKAQKYRDEGIICDLFEGNAPFRTRYIVPDYEKFMKNGSKFLGIEPAKDIWEATHNLLMLYKHVPSITTMPVYLGNLDYMLEPYIKDEEEAYRAIKLFLKHIDTTITDSFCHSNIGPKETKAAFIILRVMDELQLPTPNLTLKYSEETSDKLALAAVEAALVTAKPSFANHKVYSENFKGDYGIVSCYNGLKVGGGAYTLVRVKLGELSKKADSVEQFMDEVLPDLADAMLGYIDERVRFIVEETPFFESNFLAKEGLIERDKFTGLFGVVGLAECVNNLLKAENQEDRFGYSDKANQLGMQIVQKLDEKVKGHKNKYCPFTDGNHLLHAQVGIDTDTSDSPGCRIPVGEEPEIWDHLTQSAPFHKYFPSGIGDIFTFDDTYKKNPEAILDIIKGAFESTDLRFISTYSNDCDVVRVTGYLVKKSEIAKLEKGEAVLADTTVLGMGARDNAKAFDRKLRK